MEKAQAGRIQRGEFNRAGCPEGSVCVEGDKDVDDPPGRSGRYPGGLQGNLLVLSPQAFSGSPGRACRFLEDCALFVVDFPHVERVRQAT